MQIFLNLIDHTLLEISLRTKKIPKKQKKKKGGEEIPSI